MLKKLFKRRFYNEVKEIKSYNLDWSDFYAFNGETSALSPEEFYAENARKKSLVVPNVLDTEFYLNQNADVKNELINPLIHYFRWGKLENRLAFPVQNQPKSELLVEQVKSTTRVEQTSEPISEPVQPLPKNAKCDFEIQLSLLEIDSELFSKANNLVERCANPIKYIIENHEFMKITIPGFFDSKLYLELYPDIASAAISPLKHYLLHGKREGRIGYFNIQKHFKLGSHSFDQTKLLYVVVSHESSATGAPLVGFNLSQQLAKQANVVNIVLKESKLQDAFAEECIACVSNISVQSPIFAKMALEYIATQFKKIDGIICNSVETIFALEAANQLDIPSVSLVHEFSEYSRPTGKISNTALFADKVIVPAQVIKDSMCRELKSHRGIKTIPNNIIIQPQGRLPFIPKGHGKLDSVKTLLAKFGVKEIDDYHILVGAGYVQIRKGVDLFIAAAKRIKDLSNKPCKFVWVGEGYEPDTDLNYSNWVQTQIILNGLEDDVIFLGHQRNLDNVMELADVFCMTSRLDPFPNVVIDALDADIHVACFDESTGCAQFLKEHEANATTVPYLDIELFAAGVSQYLNGSERHLGKNNCIVKENLNFESYTNAVLTQLNEASEFKSLVAKNIETLKQSQRFDANYYDPSLSPEQALKEYVEFGVKGIHLYNPAPGFCELKWLHENNTMCKVGLLNSQDKELTHDTYRVSKENCSEVVKFKYAVHLHLFYSDLADEFAEYFSALPKGFDIFITHLEEKESSKIKKAFAKCGADNIYLRLVDNKGRDVGPFINTLNSFNDINKYSVIGHFHSKKSLEVGGPMGDNWRRFLLESLIGDSNTSAQVLGLFNDPNIGLVYAEDRHCVDSGENIYFIEKLHKEMNIKQDPNCFSFPLGTMFWARTDAISNLQSLDKSFFELDEPLPYDGSYLHAIERILPNLCQSNGFSFKTVRNEDASW